MRQEKDKASQEKSKEWKAINKEQIKLEQIKLEQIKMTESKLAYKLGYRFRLQREKHSMTQGQLASQLGISKLSIGNYEKGDRTPDAILLRKMAVLFSCSVDYLIGLTNTINPEVDNIGLSEESISIIKELDNRYPPVPGTVTGGMMSMINALIESASFEDFLIYLNRFANYGNYDILLAKSKEQATYFQEYQNLFHHDKSEDYDFTPELILKLEKMRLDDAIEALVEECKATDIEKIRMTENALGYRIRLQREKHSLSQSQLGKALNITSQTIGNYEKGDRIPDAILLRKLAALFSCSADYLIGLTNAIHPKHSNMVDNIGLSEESIGIINVLDKRYPPADGTNSGGMMSMIIALIESASFEDLLIHLNRFANRGNNDIFLEESKEQAAYFQEYQNLFQKMRLDDAINALTEELRQGNIGAITNTSGDVDPAAL